MARSSTVSKDRTLRFFDDMATPHAAAEFRSEPRRVCTGEVCFFHDGPPATESFGTLVDVSSHGFRATHSASLQFGSEVRFRHVLFVGRARLVWTRAIFEKAESGFQILRD